MRRRRNPDSTFSEEQIEEIEDRVMNLLQFPRVLLADFLETEEDKEVRYNLSIGIENLDHLVRWVRGLRPPERRWRR